MYLADVKPGQCNKYLTAISVTTQTTVTVRHLIFIRLEDRLPPNIGFIYFTGQFAGGVHAFSCNFAEGEPIWMQSGALRESTLLGAGPGTFWARSAQKRQFKRHAKFCFLLGK